ncbi:MAG: hypothetical protein LBC63_09105 [Holophagales bacterium]|nr:hypothetical protein [Holophagales bacterium]
MELDAIAEETEKSLAEMREFFDASVKELAMPFKEWGIKRAEMREIDQEDAYHGERHPTKDDEFVIIKEGKKLFVSPGFVRECLEDFKKTGKNDLVFHMSLMVPIE